MSYQKDREAFLVWFARTFPDTPIGVAESLLREASGAQKYNEIVCSIDVGERELARLERQDDRRTARVLALAAEHGLRIDVQGDPRGAPFSVVYGEGGHQSYGVPGRGLPARCFR